MNAETTVRICRDGAIAAVFLILGALLLYGIWRLIHEKPLDESSLYYDSADWWKHADDDPGEGEQKETGMTQ